MPPWVISRRVPPRLRSRIRTLLLGMHRQSFGRAILERARLQRFVEARERDYDPIRAMARKADRVSWKRSLIHHSGASVSRGRNNNHGKFGRQESAGFQP
jgi:hypothetical protein